MSNIAQLEGWLHKPYRKEQVIVAARGLGRPFLLRDVVGATQLPPHVVNRVLWRLWRAGQLRRQKVVMTYPQWNKSLRRFEPGRRQRRVSLYSFVEAR